MHRILLCTISLLSLAALLGGCARAARDTAGFQVENTLTVEKPFDDTWQLVKSVLREQELDLYTRDKRGTFVAFTDKRRTLLGFMQPPRVKYTLELAPVNDFETMIYISAVRQVYGTTLFTYPDWHDRKLKDPAKTQAIVDAILAKASEVPEAPDEGSVEVEESGAAPAVVEAEAAS